MWVYYVQASAALLQREELPVPIPDETGCAQEPIWMHRRADKSLAPAGNRTIIQRTPSL